MEKMKKDIEFLVEFQNERKKSNRYVSGETVYYGIKESYARPAHEDFADELVLYHEDAFDKTYFRNESDLFSFLDEKLGSWEKRFPNEIHLKLPFDKLKYEVIKYLGSVVNFDLMPIDWNYELVDKAIFFTKREAEQHLIENRHRYTERAHVFETTIFRSPEIERLMHILETFKWEEVKDLIDYNLQATS